jgi:hypothetical protein
MACVSTNPKVYQDAPRLIRTADLLIRSPIKPGRKPRE